MEECYFSKVAETAPLISECSILQRVLQQNQIKYFVLGWLAVFGNYIEKREL